MAAFMAASDAHRKSAQGQLDIAGGGIGGGTSSGTAPAQPSGSSPTAGSTALPLQLPPFMVAVQQGRDRYIGDFTVDAPVVFSADGVQVGTRQSSTVATATFTDTPNGLLQRSDAQYTVVIALQPAP